MLLDACKTDDKKKGDDKATEPAAALTLDRAEEEKIREKELMSTKFFTDHEMATITLLSNIIIPKDDRSGSASDAKVPEFIEFIVKDKPELQVPMRGGLRWLDMQCFKRYNNSFKDCDSKQQIEMVDEMAYPAKAKPDMKPGVAFFDRMRSLTATGFFTTKMGIDDLGYVGNVPNKWEGVPADIIKQYGLENVGFSPTVSHT